MAVLLMYPTVTEEGWIGRSSSRDLEIRHLSDGSVEGITAGSRELIEKFKLNSEAEVRFRRNLDAIIELSGRNEEQQRLTIQYFINAIVGITTLNRIASNFTVHNEDLLRSMLYANAFSALESLLSDYLINAVNADDATLARMVSGCSDVFNKKYSLKELIAKDKSPRELIVGKLRNIVFHNFAIVSNLYGAAFSIKFPDFSELEKAAANRHDIVHRNAFRVGDKHRQRYRQDQVMGLIQDMQAFVIELLNTLNKGTNRE